MESSAASKSVSETETAGWVVDDDGEEEEDVVGVEEEEVCKLFDVAGKESNK